MATFSTSVLGSTVPADPGCAEVVGDYMVVAGSGSTAPALGGRTYAVLHLPSGAARAFDGLPSGTRLARSSTVLDGIMWVVTGSGSNPEIVGINPVNGSLIGSGRNNNSGFCVAAGGRIWYGGTTLTGWSPSTNTTVTTPSGVHSSNTATAYGSDRLYTYSAADQSIREIDTDTGDVVASHPTSNLCYGRGVVIGDHIFWGSSVGMVRFHVPTGTAEWVPFTPPGLNFGSITRPRLGAGGTIWWVTHVTGPTRAQITVVNPTTMQWAQGEVPLSGDNNLKWAMWNGLPVIAHGAPDT